MCEIYLSSKIFPFTLIAPAISLSRSRAYCCCFAVYIGDGSLGMSIEWYLKLNGTHKQHTGIDEDFSCLKEPQLPQAVCTEMTVFRKDS